LNIEQTCLIGAKRTEVWNLLMDPEVLQKAIPGCQELQPISTNEYKATLKMGIGPVKGTFSGKLTLQDIDEPERYTMVIEGQGVPGFVNGKGNLSLTDLGNSTEIKVVGEANVGGTIAQVGSRMVGPAVNQMMTQFFNAIRKLAEDK